MSNPRFLTGWEESNEDRGNEVNGFAREGAWDWKKACRLLICLECKCPT